MMYTPLVANTFSARLPASLPMIETTVFNRSVAARAWRGGIQRGFNDGGCAIMGGCDSCRRSSAVSGANSSFAQEIVDVRDTDARTNVLVADVVETLAHELEQTHLGFVNRSEICMPAFRTVGAIGFAFPGKKCLAQACSGRNDSDVRALGFVRGLHGLPGREGLEVTGAKFRNRAGGRFEVIQDVYRTEGQFFCDDCLIDDPRQVGGLYTAGKDRARDAERGAVYLELRSRPGISGAMDSRLG